MEIEQSFQVPFAADRVWRCFHDVEGLVACLPGAALTEPPEGGRLALSMTVKMGPIVANFAGQGALALDDAARRGSVSGSGNDRKSGSRIKGEAAFSLHEERAPHATTRVDIRVDYSIAGSLAQFSRGGIVRELAERLTAAFAENLRGKLAADQADAAPDSAPAASAASAASSADAATKPAAAPLDLGRLFWRMLLDRLRRLFGFSTARRGDADERRD